MSTSESAAAEVREAVLGEEYVARSRANRTAFNAPLQDFAARHIWGDVWQRPGLDRSMRSVITISVLMCRGQTPELAMHIRGAVRNGLSPAQISEVLLHAGAYAGVPAAVSAFAVAQEVLRDMGFDEAHPGVEA